MVTWTENRIRLRSPKEKMKHLAARKVTKLVIRSKHQHLRQKRRKSVAGSRLGGKPTFEESEQKQEEVKPDPIRKNARGGIKPRGRKPIPTTRDFLELCPQIGEEVDISFP